MEVRGKTAIVTGAGNGIGRALAVEFAREGARVVCCGRTDRALQETVEFINKNDGTGFCIRADVSELSKVRTMVDETLKKFEQIDLLFNNAGSFECVGPMWEVEVQTARIRGELDMGVQKRHFSGSPKVLQRNSNLWGLRYLYSV